MHFPYHSQAPYLALILLLRIEGKYHFISLPLRLKKQANVSQMIQVPAHVQIGQFEASLFGCCDDLEACVDILSSSNGRQWAAMRGEEYHMWHSNACWTGVGQMFIRSNIRHARGMPLDDCADECSYRSWPFFTYIQDAREVKSIVAASLEAGTYRAARYP
jgi:hypothetical protein